MSNNTKNNNNANAVTPRIDFESEAPAAEAAASEDSDPAFKRHGAINLGLPKENSTSKTSIMPSTAAIANAARQANAAAASGRKGGKRRARRTLRKTLRKTRRNKNKRTRKH